jgi:hypothetical protein
MGMGGHGVGALAALVRSTIIMATEALISSLDQVKHTDSLKHVLKDLDAWMSLVLDGKQDRNISAMDGIEECIMAITTVSLMKTRFGVSYGSAWMFEQALQEKEESVSKLPAAAKRSKRRKTTGIYFTGT